MTDEPPLNLANGFTVSAYFPPGCDPEWVSAFLGRVAEDAHGMPSDTLDAFVVGHAGDVLGIDGVADEQELTHAEALELVDDLGLQTYRAEDRLAFVREMCDAADRSGEQVTTEQVRAWTQYEGCGGVLRLPDEVLPMLREFAATDGVAAPATQASEPTRSGWLDVAKETLLAADQQVTGTPEMSAEEWQRLEAETAMSDVDTPGCDCGHDGLGVRWHASDCDWRAGER